MVRFVDTGEVKVGANRAQVMSTECRAFTIASYTVPNASSPFTKGLNVA